MAKIAFTKLNAKVNTEEKVVQFNNCDIEVKQYLPIKEKMQLINDIVNQAIERNYNFYNPGEIEVAQVLAIIENYTNLTFTAKQKEDPAKLYDIVASSGLAKIIISQIEDEELNAFEELLYNSLNNVYKYRNSFIGMLEVVQNDYADANYDASAIQEKLASNKEVLEMLKTITSNLG